MSSLYLPRDRRHFLRHLAGGTSVAAAAAFLARCHADPGVYADLVVTPRQTEGPFYPNHLPLDTDNDLLIINNGLTPATGEICHLSGRVLSQSGEPVRNAVVEIWQADNNGCYIHTGSSNRDKQDKNFQGFGRFTTNARGEYYFRTIRPVPYKPRTPHIHFAVYRNGQRMLTTQCYINGHPLNESDGVLKGLRSAEDRQRLMVDFTSFVEQPVVECTATFDIVIGVTPEEREAPPRR